MAAKFAAIFFTMILVDNYVLVKFLGICPFLGVSKKLNSAFGMSCAVIFVMALATAVTWPIQNFLLTPTDAEGNLKWDLGYLQTIVFILVIAVLVQLVEIIMKKYMPPLHKALGVYLPLITTNCAVLGVCEMVIGDMSSILGAGVTMNTGWAILYAAFAGLGFTLVMIIMSGLREKIDCYGNMPKALKGFPIAMITASIICMAFTVFSYITI